LAPDGDTLDAMTPRSSVPKLGWRNAVDAPFVPSLSTGHRGDAAPCFVRHQVALRRGDAQGEPGIVVRVPVQLRARGEG
jgi:hypothetical protein